MRFSQAPAEFDSATPIHTLTAPSASLHDSTKKLLTNQRGRAEMHTCVQCRPSVHTPFFTTQFRGPVIPCSISDRAGAPSRPAPDPGLPPESLRRDDESDPAVC